MTEPKGLSAAEKDSAEATAVDAIEKEPEAQAVQSTQLQPLQQQPLQSQAVESQPIQPQAGQRQLVQPEVAPPPPVQPEPVQQTEEQSFVVNEPEMDPDEKTQSVEQREANQNKAAKQKQQSAKKRRSIKKEPPTTDAPRPKKIWYKDVNAKDFDKIAPGLFLRKIGNEFIRYRFFGGFFNEIDENEPIDLRENDVVVKIEPEMSVSSDIQRIDANLNRENSEESKQNLMNLDDPESDSGDIEIINNEEVKVDPNAPNSIDTMKPSVKKFVRDVLSTRPLAIAKLRGLILKSSLNKFAFIQKYVVDDCDEYVAPEGPEEETEEFDDIMRAFVVGVTMLSKPSEIGILTNPIIPSVPIIGTDDYNEVIKNNHLNTADLESTPSDPELSPYGVANESPVTYFWIATAHLLPGWWTAEARERKKKTCRLLKNILIDAFAESDDDSYQLLQTTEELLEHLSSNDTASVIFILQNPFECDMPTYIRRNFDDNWDIMEMFIRFEPKWYLDEDLIDCVGDWWNLHRRNQGNLWKFEPKRVRQSLHGAGWFVAALFARFFYPRMAPDTILLTQEHKKCVWLGLYRTSSKKFHEVVELVEGEDYTLNDAANCTNNTFHYFRLLKKAQPLMGEAQIKGYNEYIKNFKKGRLLMGIAKYINKEVNAMKKSGKTTKKKTDKSDKSTKKKTNKSDKSAKNASKKKKSKKKKKKKSKKNDSNDDDESVTAKRPYNMQSHRAEYPIRRCQKYTDPNVLNYSEHDIRATENLVLAAERNILRPLAVNAKRCSDELCEKYPNEVPWIKQEHVYYQMNNSSCFNMPKNLRNNLVDVVEELREHRPEFLEHVKDWYANTSLKKLKGYKKKHLHEEAVFASDWEEQKHQNRAESVQNQAQSDQILPQPAVQIQTTNVINVVDDGGYSESNQNENDEGGNSESNQNENDYEEDIDIAQSRRKVHIFADNEQSDEICYCLVELVVFEALGAKDSYILQSVSVEERTMIRKLLSLLAKNKFDEIFADVELLSILDRIGQNVSEKLKVINTT